MLRLALLRVFVYIIRCRPNISCTFFFWGGALGHSIEAREVAGWVRQLYVVLGVAREKNS